MHRSDTEKTMKRICVLTEDVMLFLKIKYELSDGFEVVMSDSREVTDTVLVDVDNPKFASEAGIKMSRSGADITLPFRIGELKSMLSEDKSELTIRDDGTVYVGARAVRLTDVEMSLFSALYKRRGDYATREELVSEVWGNGSDEGILNVYIHYLRSKLEANGERVISCTRGKGYKLNEKYFGGYDA